MSNRAQNRAKDRLKKRANRAVRTAYKAAKTYVDYDKTESLLACFTLAMHDVLGTGKEDCLAVLQKADEYMLPIIIGECSIQEIKNRLQNEVDILIKC